MLVPEVGLSLDFVRADSDGNGTLFAELNFGIAEPASLSGSPGGVRLGVEEENYIFLAGIVTQLYLLSMIIGEGEIGGLVSFFDH